MSTVFAAVVGQENAVAQLRAAAGAPVHAYLLVGPPDSGKRAAALGFAAALLCPDGGCGVCSTCRRVAAGNHTDVSVVERRGPSIDVPQAKDIVRLAAMSPREGRRKVMVLVDFHLVQNAAPVLLKTIEEPPASTFFVILADYVPPELVTIASRCVRLHFDVLARGTDVPAHRVAWAEVPTRLDGTGATVSIVAAELLELVTSAGSEPLMARQAAEVAELSERAELTGERGIGRKEMEERHKREQRRLRTDELRFGLATLEAAYRDRAAAAVGSAARGPLESARAVQKATQALERNPNESLLLQALMIRLTPH